MKELNELSERALRLVQKNIETWEGLVSAQRGQLKNMSNQIKFCKQMIRAGFPEYRQIRDRWKRNRRTLKRNLAESSAHLAQLKAKEVA